MTSHALGGRGSGQPADIAAVHMQQKHAAGERRISDMTSHCHDGGHDVISRRKGPRCHTVITRKLSYRKDDRAMRPIYGCYEHFRVPRYARGYFSRNF